MNFIDPLFLLAFPCFYLVYRCLGHVGKLLWLCLSSYLFYMWNSPEYGLLLACSTLVDLVLSKWMEDRRIRSKLWLVLSISFNMGLLLYFKYMAFLWNEAWLPFAQASFAGTPWPTMAAQLPPVGISFFTFQTMSYSIDVYRGRLKACRSVLVFATYVSCFPQLVAGPIVRAKDLLHQMEANIAIPWLDVREGLLRFSRGFLKKTCLADPLALLWVDSSFAQISAMSAEQQLLALVAYSFQIYFDFSAYSDMAIGLGRLLGFRFPENFDHPYRSASFSEFWTRWHISLSSWLRDYLYISLGGNRHGSMRTYLHLLITMLLGGLWHGASWMFLLWGALHGAWLVLQRLVAGYCPEVIVQRCPRVVLVLLVFVLVVLTWAPFRAQSLDDVYSIWYSCFSFSPSRLWDLMEGRPLASLLLLLAVYFQFFHEFVAKRLSWERWPWEFKFSTITCASLVLLSFYPEGGKVSPFIYFQF